MFTLSLVIITMLTASIPMCVSTLRSHFPKLKLDKTYSWIPLLAAVCFIGAFFLPNIHISAETSTFQQHFVGGGVYCALLFLYFQKLLGWKTNWLLGLIVLFAWTSAFGVANELMEFTLTKLHLASIGTGDTDWDLLANTSGSLITYLLYLLVRNSAKLIKRRR